MRLVFLDLASHTAQFGDSNGFVAMTKLFSFLGLVMSTSFFGCHLPASTTFPPPTPIDLGTRNRIELPVVAHGGHQYLLWYLRIPNERGGTRALTGPLNDPTLRLHASVRDASDKVVADFAFSGQDLVWTNAFEPDSGLQLMAHHARTDGGIERYIRGMQRFVATVEVVEPSTLLQSVSALVVVTAPGK